MPLIFLALCIGVYPFDSYAYVNPGLGMGVLSLVFGVIGGILLLFISILYYPIKRVIRVFRKPKIGPGPMQP